MAECDLTPNTSDKNTPLCCHRENIQHSQVKRYNVNSENNDAPIGAFTHMRNQNCTYPNVEMVFYHTESEQNSFL